MWLLSNLFTANFDNGHSCNIIIVHESWVGNMSIMFCGNVTIKYESMLYSISILGSCFVIFKSLLLTVFLYYLKLKVYSNNYLLFDIIIYL